MKVFLSHAIADKDIVDLLKIRCSKSNLQLLVAEHVLSVDKTITQKIEGMIRASSIALFLLTDNGNDSRFVHQEIGYSKSLNKPSIYIIQKGSIATGFAFGHDFIELDPEQPDIAIKKAIERLLTHWKKLLEIEQEQKKVAGFLIAGLITLALLSD